MNRWSRMPTTSAGCRRSESGVKSTTSANRIDAAANWSAIVGGVGLEPVGDRARQDVQQQGLGTVLLDAQLRERFLALADELDQEPEHDRAARR